MRRMLYKFLRIANDVNAIKRGKYGKRVLRKYSYRKGGNFINNLFK